MNSAPPNVSFIGIVDFSEHARWLFLSPSVSDLLGFEPHELFHTPSLDLVHPDEFPSVKKLHYDTISQDKAAVLAYLRLRHKDPYKGYILCAISRTVAYNVLVGSVSFASMGAGAMRNASTAQEVTVITPSARNFEFRRWGDPSPMHPTALADSSDESGDSSGSDTETEAPPSGSSPYPSGPTDGPVIRRTRKELSPKRPEESDASPPASDAASPPTDKGKEAASPSKEQQSSDSHADDGRSSRDSSRSRRESSSKKSQEGTPPTIDPQSNVISFEPLPKQSIRTALFLNRFSSDCIIEYCSNDNFVQTTEVMGRPFFDFVVKKDEDLVRSWIDAIKTWGVNERGQPSDGGFGYGKFTLYLPGRDSRERDADGTRGRHRPGSRGASGRQERRPSSHSAAPKTSNSRPRPRGRTRDEMRVDAIFSAHSDGLMVIIRHASKF